MKADKIYINTEIWTGDSNRPVAEAIATCDDIIIAVGYKVDVLRYKSKETLLIDLDGKFMVPGFIDSHVHLMEGGFSLSALHLKDAGTKEEFIYRLRKYAGNISSSEWILGGSWDNKNWGGELPTRAWIDGFTENKPVFIKRSDIHTVLVNGAALEIAGIDEDTADPAGGEIGRFPDGRPNGILRDNAIHLVGRHVPAPSKKRRILALESAMAYLAANGVSSVHHMGSREDYSFLREIRSEGLLRTRIYSTMPLWEYEDIIGLKSEISPDEKWLKLNGAKLFADGSLGSHTAAFTEPYSDDPDETGLLIYDPEKILQGIIAADGAGLQMVAHAIGDRANHIILDKYEEAIRINGQRDRRFRIEHAQHLLPEDIIRFGRSGIIASMQPWHLMDDGRWAEKSLGKVRSRYAYCFRSLIDSGAKMTFGSDWPVAPANPLLGIHAAATRHTLDGKHPEGWTPSEKIKVEEALRAYTINPSYASFEEDLKGTLSEGKLADMVVLDRNILYISPEEIKEVKVLMTIIGGELVFRGNF